MKSYSDYASLCARLGLTLSLPLLCQSAVAANIGAGDLIVSEVLANPAAVSDTQGEWLEIYNASQSNLDINGLVLRDNGSNQHTISAATPLLIGAGEYFVLGRSENQATNGNYQPDYVYSNFTLSNSNDAIVLEWLGESIFSLDYTAANSFGTAGVSMTLEGTLPAQISAASYGATAPEYTFGAGDRGTPGTGNIVGNAVSEVPLPAAGLLFSTALGMMAGIKRRAKPAY